MASFMLNSPSLALCFPPMRVSSVSSPHELAPPAVSFFVHPSRRKTGGLTVVTRAGPSTNTYLLAAALPFSLLAITIFTSIRIADKLEKDFLEELAINEAMKEAEEDDDDDDDDNDNDNDEVVDEDVDDTVLEEEIEEPVLSRTRNRPKREA